MNAIISADHPVSARWVSEQELDSNPELVRTMSVTPPRGQGQVRLLEIAGIPGGHLKLPQSWPGQTPPGEGDGTRDDYSLRARLATRVRASLSRQLLPSNFSRCA
jgi:hypothetical protein